MSSMAHVRALRRGTLPFGRAVLLAALLGACSDDADGEANGVPAEAAARGDLLELTPLASLDRSEVAALLVDHDLDPSAVWHGVDAYRVVYHSVDPGGALVRASSLLALPQGEGLVPEQVAWMHGTTVYRGDAASVNAESDDRAAALFFAAAGYATTAPDYIGLGLGEGTHPYDHIPTEVTAGIDGLAASARAARQLGRELGSALSLSGHSQGGPAAVALAREVQSLQARESASGGLVLTSLAPISGPYDMSGSVRIAARGGIAYVTAYLGYLTVAWNRWLGLYATPSEAFLPPYDQTLEGLFDNEHTTEQVFAGLPQELEQLFTADFLVRLREPSGALAAALDEASRVCDWQPLIEVEVYASSADADVPIANAEHCVESFRASGAEVRLVDLGDADHSQSMTRSLPLVLAQFENQARR
jgi:hypothetical protein